MVYARLKENFFGKYFII